MPVTINIYDGCHRCDGPKVLWTIGPVREMPGPFLPPKQPITFHHSNRGEVVANFQLTDTQQVGLTISAADKRGNPVPSSSLNNVTWQVDNPNVLALNATGATATVSAQGPLGTATVSVSAALPDGTTVGGQLAIDVISGAAVQITITPGTPTEQP